MNQDIKSMAKISLKFVCGLLAGVEEFFKDNESLTNQNYEQIKSDVMKKEIDSLFEVSDDE